MQQIYEAKVVTLTRGGLADGKKTSVVTTNCKKSAEVIVPRGKKLGKDRTIISFE